MRGDARFVLYGCVILTLIMVATWRAVQLRGQPPTPILRIPCKVIEVVDGDTLTVEVTLQARVRLKDCWAPETGTPEGDLARQYMRRVSLHKDGVLEVDLASMRRLDDAFSFGRLVGRVYVDGNDLSQRIVLAGHATTTKGGG